MFCILRLDTSNRFTERQKNLLHLWFRGESQISKSFRDQERVSKMVKTLNTFKPLLTTCSQRRKQTAAAISGWWTTAETHSCLCHEPQFHNISLKTPEFYI